MEMKTLTINGQTFQVRDSTSVQVETQTLTEEQEKQARNNIGALGAKAVVESIEFPGSVQDAYVSITSGSSGQSGPALIFGSLEGENLDPPVLRSIADGVEVNDAATVGQLNQKAEGLYDEVIGHATDNFVWYSEAQTLTDAQKSQARDNIGAMGRKADGNLNMNDHQIYGVKMLSLASLDFPGNNQDECVSVVSGSAGDYIPALLFSGYEENMIPVLRSIHDGIEDSDAATVGQLNAAVGDIEAALDSILAIQETLIGGESA